MKTLSYSWAVLATLMFLTLFSGLITDQIHLSVNFLGIIIFLFGLSFVLSPHIFYKQYLERGLAKATASSLSIFIFSLGVLFAVGGLTIMAADLVSGNFILVTLFSSCALVLATYGLVGTRSREIIFILPLPWGLLNFTVKGKIAQVYGFILISISVVVFFSIYHILTSAA